MKTWDRFAARHKNGILWYVGEKWWVDIHRSDGPTVPVRVELLDDTNDDRATHYGWVDLEHLRPDNEPIHIYPRADDDVRGGGRTRLLAICFPYGIEAEVSKGRGRPVALHVTELEATP